MAESIGALHAADDPLTRRKGIEEAFEVLRTFQPDQPAEFIGSIVKLFRAGGESRVNDLRNALSPAGDTRRAERAAHTLRGSALSVGALRLAALCAALETRTREGTRVDAAAVEEIETEFKLVIAELELELELER